MSSINPPGVDRLAQLNALHLYGMAAAWSELLAEGPRRRVQPEAWLDRLIDAELADRLVRSLRYQLKAARFPAHRDLTAIDWGETPLPQAQIQQLASAAFMQTAHNLILVGGTGTGKTLSRRLSAWPPSTTVHPSTRQILISMSIIALR
jgi:DNA replication protein DnaC